MSTRISSPNFIGRRAELEQARAALVRAADGEPGPILVSGEAGIGKSRLLAELAEWAIERGYRVLTGGCVSLSAEVAPFAPIVQALRPLAHTLPPPELEGVLGASRRALAPLLPELIPAGVASGATGISQDGSRERLLEQFLGLLHRLGTSSPVLLVIEDVHWADASTIDVMTFLARNLEAEPIQLVATVRSDEPHAGRAVMPFIAEIGRHPRTVRIDLQPFNRVELAEQISGILGAPATATVVQELLHRSQGNAFFVEELIAAGGLPGVLPESLQDVLRARVAALSPGTAELVRVASATGRRFSEVLLAAVAGSSGAQFRRALREALEQQILVRDQDGAREVLRFRHALVQEILHGDLLPSERQDLHAACARVLDEEPGAADDPALASELAHHWHAAAQPERALHASVVAGLAAEAAGAPVEAAAQFERAIQLFEQLPDTASGPGLDAVQVREHAAANLLADPARAVSHIRDALALVDSQREPIRAGLLTAALGRYLWFSGDGAAALAAARKAVRLVPPEPPGVELARVTAGLGQILMILAHLDEGTVVAEEAVRLARLAGAELIESHALSTLGLLRAYAGDVEAGLEMQRRALQIAAERESLDDVGRAYTNLSDTLMVVAARFDDAEKVALEAVGRADGLQVGGVWAAAAWRDIAWARYLTGRWDEAVEALERAPPRGQRGRRYRVGHARGAGARGSW